MMNIPGSLVRGAGNIVGGAVNSVASATGLRKHGSIGNSSDVITVVKEKTTLHVKDTPSKDATTTSALAIKTDFLLKRNEQGVWQKRYCCMVPHMYLYYFESEYAESPRGVIDLEYFTCVDIQGENVLRLGTPDHIQSRQFFFQINDPVKMSEWMAAFHRERYIAVRDERDAYQQLQEQFSGQMDMTAKMMETNKQESERSQHEIAKLKKTLDELTTTLQDTLKLCDVSPTVASSSDPSELATCLRQSVIRLKSSAEEQIVSDHNIFQEEKFALEERLETLEKRLLVEQQHRRTLETQLINDKRDHEAQLREAISQLEKANHSYQVAWTMKSGLEGKYHAVSEQKKILIKEVKGLRKKVDEKDERNNQLAELNDKLTQRLQELQQQMENMEYDGIKNDVANLLQESNQFKMAQSESAASLESAQEDDSKSDTEKVGTTLEPSEDAVDPSVMKNLTWMSNEQRELLERSSKQSKDESSPMLSKFTSLFKSDRPTLSPSPTAQFSSEEVLQSPEKRLSDETTNSSEYVHPGTNIGALKCYRCGGSVEGPKYSTCKCAIPQLTEEKPSSFLTGMMSKSKSAAGGISSGFRRMSLNPLDLFKKDDVPPPPSDEANDDVPFQRESSIDSVSWLDTFGPSTPKSFASKHSEKGEKSSSAPQIKPVLRTDLKMRPHGVPSHRTSIPAVPDNAEVDRAAADDDDPEEVLGTWEQHEV